MKRSTTRSVMIVVSTNARRGAEVFGERLDLGLSDAGWTTDFVALSATSTDRIVPATPIAHAGRGAWIDITAVRALRRRIRADRPSIVLANGGRTLRVVAGALAGMPNRPGFAYASIGEPRYWLRSRGHRRLQAALHKRPDVILAVSKATAQQVVEIFDVPPSKVHVAHTGVSGDHFAPHRQPGPTLKLLFLGSLSAEKDPLAALDTVTTIHASRPVELRLVGGGPLIDDVRRAITERDAFGYVTTTGPVNDVVPHLAWADALILTSRTEGLPGVAIEAGAAGVPTFAFDVGGTREAMVPGESGIVVPRRDPSDLATAILHIGPAEIHRMGDRARQHIEEHFTIERAIDRYDELLRAAADRRTR